MSPLFNKKLRLGRPRKGRRNDNLMDITKAATRLLAQKDFEIWSMAQLARDAGCSVGTLYARFSDKHGCLHHLINATFRSMSDTAAAELSPKQWGPLVPSAKVNLLVNHVVSAMTEPNAAGIIRATIKLATVRPEVIEAFEGYRKTISDYAVAMLNTDVKEKASANVVRVAVQIMLATVTEAILLQKPGPMTAGSERMKSALSNVVRGYIGITNKDKWSGTEADDDEKPIDKELLASPPNSGEALYDPERGGFRRTKLRKPAKPKKTKTAPAQATTVFRTPPNVPISKALKASRSPQRKRRVI